MATLVDLINACIDAKARNIFTSMPGKVAYYDAETQIAQVKPLTMLPKDGYVVSHDIVDPNKDVEYVELDVLMDVPVQQLIVNGGKTGIRLPIKKGDLGMLFFTTFSIDKYITGDGQLYNAVDLHTHSLSDAYFVPGILPMKAAQNSDSSNSLIVKHNDASITITEDNKFKIATKVAGLDLSLLDLISDFMNNVATGTIMIETVPTTLSTAGAIGAAKLQLDSIKG